MTKAAEPSTIERWCVRCGAEFVAQLYGPGQGRLYCGPVCRNLAYEERGQPASGWSRSRMLRALRERAQELQRSPYPEELLRGSAGDGWPSPWLIAHAFGTWSAALAAADLPPVRPRSVAARLRALDAVRSAPAIVRRPRTPAGGRNRSDEDFWEAL